MAFQLPTQTGQQSQQMALPAKTIAPFGYCDSYFVESHDDDEDGVFARAAAERERSRNMARIRQKGLAEELSRKTAEEYQDDVLDHMERIELESMPDIHSIEIQTEIQWYMRPYLLDFLLEAHHAFGLLPETLHLACNLLDRYCSRRVVYKRHYQLVGCASLLIAAKYGDRKERVPTIRELRSMCCSLYDDDMFTQMEWHVLQTLNWIIGHPTITGFLQLALTEVAADPELEHMCWYLSELSLYHKEFISLRPSVMARSCLALARCILGRPQPCYGSWSARYDAQVVISLSNHLSHPSQALVRKFSSPHLSAVSSTIDTFLKHQAMLAQRAAQASMNEMNHMDVDHSTSKGYLTPQTPQKPGYAPGPVGMLTPPITPDKDYGSMAMYNAHQVPVSRVSMTTPTPPNGDHMQQTFDAIPNYIRQPHYVQ
jgi:hypothetical protein